VTRRFVPPPTLLDSELDRGLPVGFEEALNLGVVAPKSVDVLIVGAGVAGTTLASHLWHSSFNKDFFLVDDRLKFMETFRSRIRGLGQTVLRSPYEHHVGAHNHRDCELLDHGRSLWRYLSDIERGEIRRALSGERSVVPLDMFESFLRVTCAAHDLTSRSCSTRVEQVERLESGFAVSTTAGRIEARSLVWAGGEPPRATPSDWQFGSDTPLVDPWNPSPVTGRLAIIGGGLTAAQAVVRFVRRGATVTWIMRHSERFRCADVNAKFFRPEGRAQFMSLDMPGRQSLLLRERRSSVMFELRPELARLEGEGSVSVFRDQGDVRVERVRDEWLVTTAAGGEIWSDDVCACLGLQSRLPEVLAPLLVEVAGPYPTLDDQTLESSVKDLFFLGGLASLAIGPPAKNLDGARVGSQRIVAELERRRQHGP
jgi:Pyridine nucleotide-disulphide oxidoreductase